MRTLAEGAVVEAIWSVVLWVAGVTVALMLLLAGLIALVIWAFHHVRFA
jgi:hypothetical protein